MKMMWGLKVLGTDFANKDHSQKAAQDGFDVFLLPTPYPFTSAHPPSCPHLHTYSGTHNFSPIAHLSCLHTLTHTHTLIAITTSPPLTRPVPSLPFSYPLPSYPDPPSPPLTPSPLTTLIATHTTTSILTPHLSFLHVSSPPLTSTHILSPAHPPPFRPLPANPGSLCSVYEHLLLQHALGITHAEMHSRLDTSGLLLMRGGMGNRHLCPLKSEPRQDTAGVRKREGHI